MSDDTVATLYGSTDVTSLPESNPPSIFRKSAENISPHIFNGLPGILVTQPEKAKAFLRH
jgi:hypothetical protein